VKTRQPFLSRLTSSTRPLSSQRFRVMGATPTNLAAWLKRYLAIIHTRISTFPKPYQGVSYLFPHVRQGKTA
jgi:hypothetical protein